MNREMQKCPTCHRSVELYKTIFSRCHVEAVRKAYVRSVDCAEQVIRVKDLKLTNAEYTKFASLVDFGLLYKNESMKRGEYGVPRQRVYNFLCNTVTVPAYVWTDPTTKTHTLADERIRLDQVPNSNRIKDIYGETYTEHDTNPAFNRPTGEGETIHQ